MKNTKNNFLLKVFALTLFLSSISFGQLRTNLDVFHSLLDSTVAKFVSENQVQGNKIQFQFNQDNVYPTFRNYFLADLSKKFQVVNKPATSENIPLLNYSIDETSIKYGEMFRDGFLGDFLVPRNITLKGTYSLSSDKTYNGDFNFTSQDTVSADDLKSTNDINSIENDSFPFTKGEKPTEPFFASLFEPIVAIGSAAVAIILFFTIRSK